MTDKAPDAETPADGLAVPDEDPTRENAAGETPAGETPAGEPAPATDPATLELKDELDSIRALGENLRG